MSCLRIVISERSTRNLHKVIDMALHRVMPRVSHLKQVCLVCIMHYICEEECEHYSKFGVIRLRKLVYVQPFMCMSFDNGYRI